jgi:hypothetical protein
MRRAAWVYFSYSVLGQGLSILLGLTVERYASPYTGLVTFIAAYFALFWFAWKAAVWLTEPGKRLAKLFGGAAERVVTPPTRR